MKRVLIFSVIFAVLAGAVFAEVSVGAWGRGSVNVLENDYVNDEIKGSWGQDMRAEFSGENDEGSFGGHLKLWLDNSYDTFGWVWWKPIDQFRMQIGHNTWADFEVGQIVRWGFYADAGDAQVVAEKWKFGNAFYDGFSASGMNLSIYPVDGLSLNLGLPYGRGSELSDIFKHMAAQVQYNIADIGNIAFTFKVGGGTIKETDWDEWAKKDAVKDNILYKVMSLDATDPGYMADLIKLMPKALQDKGADLKEQDITDWMKRVYAANMNNPDLYPSSYDVDASALYLSFYLTAIENLEANIGFRFELPITGEKDEFFDEKSTYQPPIYAGAGVGYSTDAFGIKARVMAGFGGNVKYDGKEIERTPFSLDFDLLPYFDVGIMKIFISLGIAMTGAQEQATEPDKFEEVKESSVLGFHFNPYITKNIGAGTFFAGFRLESPNLTVPSKENNMMGEDLSPAINWKVPIGIIFGF